MDAIKQQFLAGIMGATGSEAMIKASERSPALEYALVPRAILSWVCSGPRYEGEIPGVENTAITFSKSENGFTGGVAIEGKNYRFDDVSAFYVAASIGVALGVKMDEAPEGLRDLDIDRLGKSLDTLIKVKRVGDELAKKLPNAPSAMKKQLVLVAKDELDKAAGKEGHSAAPLAPTAPIAPTNSLPTQPKSTPTKLPKLPGTAGAKTPKAPTAVKPVGVKLTRSEADHACPSCGMKNFTGNKFTGCTCFKVLAKNVKVVGSNMTGLTIEFDMRHWDREGVLTFLESVGRRGR